eukprot:3418251-Pleurochrysis_carterae.AAC.1
MQRSERQTPRGTTSIRPRVPTWTTAVRQAVAQAIPPKLPVTSMARWSGSPRVRPTPRWTSCPSSTRPSRRRR